MSFGAATARAKTRTARSDAELIAACLRGKEAAWDTLIARYKNLIFSIPIKQGFTQEEAADIFQAVCLELFCELASLREPQALAGWLIQVTRHKCYHRVRENARYVTSEDGVAESLTSADLFPEKMLQEIERDQYVRDAIGDLSPRCQLLVEKLFFELPARPYEQVARELGLATGSIGIVRRRCLDDLRDRLAELGVL